MPLGVEYQSVGLMPPN